MLLAEPWQGTLPVLVATWRPAQHNHRTLSPTCDEVVNLTGFAENKGLNISNGKKLKFVESKHKAVKDCRLYVKDKDRDP